MRFVVIIAVYNMADWIGSNIDALKKQSYGNFRCFIGDDVSTDNSVDVIKRHIAGDDRFTLVEHRQKKYSFGNIHDLIGLASPAGDDIIVLVDGDDRLAHDNVLQRLYDIYRQHDCWMTYGSYADEGGTRDAICHPYPHWVVRLHKFRWVKWRASHLKTFRHALWRSIPFDAFTITAAELRRARRRALWQCRWSAWRRWRHIELADLLDPAMRFARRCSDKNITIPMLDLAGPRALFVSEILYIYKTYDKKLDFTRRQMHQKWFTRLIRDILQHKPELPRLQILPRDGGQSAVPE